MRKTIATILAALTIPFLTYTPAYAASEKHCKDQHDPFGARTCLRVSWNGQGNLTQIRVCAEGNTYRVLGYYNVYVTGAGVYWWVNASWNGNCRTQNYPGNHKVTGKRMTYEGVVKLAWYPDDHQTISFIVG